jgi:tetratricopeptide (TPR) repeat protein
MPETLKKLRIFAASPSDVASERAKLETVVDLLKPMADYLGLTLEVVDWRAVVPDAGRPQQVIFDQLKPTSWDIFIGILWHRFGTPPGGKDPQSQKDYLSGTEEEFRTAYRLWKEYEKPRIVMYRCSRPIPQEADFTQAQRVKDFFKEIQDPSSEFRVLTQSFDTTESFHKLLLDNLQKLLIKFGEQEKTPITPEVEQVLAPKIPNNLPRRQAFFGRVNEIGKVMSTIALEQTWGVVIDGIGGIGKSAIAIESAYRAQEKGMFDAFVFVTAKTNILDPSGIKELDPPARTLDEFLNETVYVLGQSGIAKLTGNEKRRALIDVLRSMRTLLVYDNLETLSKEEQDGIAGFLSELPQGCKAIITSRRRGGEGALWLRVEKLDWDASLGIIRNQMSLDEGLANKLNHIGEARWQELFDETNGSPLALVHTLGLMRVRATLTFDGTLKMLRGNRDRNLQEFIFQEARKDLTENDKAALGALSFFVPSVTFEAWVEVVQLSRHALEATIDRLSALSLVDVLIGEERYSLHPLTRAFVRDELFANEDSTREMGFRFARYWVGYVERHGGASSNYETFNYLEAESMNLEAAANWLWKISGIKGSNLENKEAARQLVRLARRSERFLRFQNHWDEHIKLNDWGYEAARLLQDWSGAGWCARAVAWTLIYRGDIDQAETWAKKCEEAWTLGGSINQKGIAIKLRGTLAQQRKEYPKAEQLFLEALQMRNDRGVAIMQTDLGELAHERGDYETAEQYYLQGLKWAKNNNDIPRQASRTANLGQLAVDREYWADARVLFDDALKLARKVGRQDDIARIKYGLALVCEQEGNVDLALAQAQDALKIYKQLQHRDLTKVRELVEKLRSQRQ